MTELRRIAGEIKSLAAQLETEVLLAREAGRSWEWIAAEINGPPRLPGGRSTSSVRYFYAGTVRRRQHARAAGRVAARDLAP